MGASLLNGQFQIDRYSLDGPHEHSQVETGGAQPAQWMLGPSGTTVAWLSGANRISVQRVPLDGQTPWPSPKIIDAPSDLLTFGILEDGTIGVVRASGQLMQRDPAAASTGAKLTVGSRITWAQIRGDYAAVATDGKIRMYRLVKQTWTMMEERSDFSGAAERRLPADGQILAIVRGGISLGEQTLNTPGKVADVAMSDQGFVFVSGDFKGIYALPTGTTEPYLVADSPAGVQVAASRQGLAYTGPGGTVLLPLNEGSRLNDTGRLIIALATALILLAILGGLLLLFIDGKGMEPNKRKTAGLKDSKLPKPPPDLIAAISSGQATLWAGAGLSASSGLPLRNAFISSVFQIALVEHWLRPAQLDKYWKLITDGKPEEALDQFIASDAANRIRVADLVRSSFDRFAATNDAQRLLAELPFNTAITTNYDTLLARTGSEWAINTAYVDGGAAVLALGSHLTVKLFGSCEAGRPAVLGRADFAEALAANPEFVAAYSDLFEARPILFVGASIEGLLADLQALRAPRPSGIKHYCIAGVSTLNWKATANQLKNRYGIEVLPCDVLNIQDQLKSFLMDLKQGVEERLEGLTDAKPVGQKVA